MRVASILLAAVGMTSTTSAYAAVRYEFTTPAGPGASSPYQRRIGYGNFTLTTKDFISKNGGIAATSFDSCSLIQPTADASCLMASFNPLTAGGYSTMAFYAESTRGDWYSYQWLFTGGAFDAPGTYTSIVNPFDPVSSVVVYTLRVTQIATAVPEPSSWVMMIGGFGLLGAALRHRRRGGAGESVRVAV